MPDGAVLIFAAFVRRLSYEGVSFVLVSENVHDTLPKCGLSQIIFENSIKVIYSSYEKAPLSFGHHLLTTFEEKTYQKTLRYLKLSDAGQWLADWITNNPAPRPEAEEVPPTE